jgi:DNA gyrase subunit B
VLHLMTGKTAFSPPVFIRKEIAEQSLICEVAMQYHDGYNETLLTFANNINNVDGGTHGQGFKVALTRTLNNYARQGADQGEGPGSDRRGPARGLIAIVSVKLPDPTFNNQPKEKLLNPRSRAS